MKINYNKVYVDRTKLKKLKAEAERVVYDRRRRTMKRMVLISLLL